jgi:hypothetical protein
MAAFFKIAFFAIRHKFFIDNDLQKIIACYKMARWPLIILQIFFLCATFRAPSETKLESVAQVQMTPFRG